MKNRIVCALLALSLTVFMAGCKTKDSSADHMITEEVETQDVQQEAIEGASYLSLSEKEITMDGFAVTTDTAAAVYVANDIVYYEENKDFTYGAGREEDAHSQEEAQQHTVLHITKPGTYVLSGRLEAGQVAVDLGEDAKDDPDAVVTLVLDGVDISCSVAPGVIFYNVYECCSSDAENAVKEVDTSAAGANVVIADGSTNTVNGSYVAKIYKSVELNEDGTEITDSKKLHKYDGAFYSKMSMNVNGGEIGDGILNINAENEGLDSELHLTINGGQIHIVSGNDGINTNEDGVSVTTVNGGYLGIKVDGSTGEGDGIDSNGWLVINGGIVSVSACADSPDAGLDSDNGICLNGGIIAAGGNMYDHISDSGQNYVVFSFRDKIKAEEEILLKKGEESWSFSMPNDFSYLVISNPELTEGTYTLWKGETRLGTAQIDPAAGKGGMLPPEGGQEGERPEPPEGEKEGERPEFPEGEKEGERPELPEGKKEGERPEPPEGEKGGERPGLPEGEEPGDGRGGFMKEWSEEELSTEFEIKTGGNMFVAVEMQKEA